MNVFVVTVFITIGAVKRVRFAFFMKTDKFTGNFMLTFWS